MRRLVISSALLAATLVLAPQTARADSLIGFFGGGFFPKGESSRDRDEVFRENFTFRTYWDDPGSGDLMKVFNGPQFGGEYLLGIGDYVEAGVGAGYYQKTEDSFYTDFTDTDGTDIEQTTKLRIIPLTLSVRVFPIGRTTPVQPYVGAGVNFYKWNFSEYGEFIDFSDDSLPIFDATEDDFADSGTAIGPTIFAGVRAPIGNTFLLGGEVRWQGGTADLDPRLNFAGNKLDLGGIAASATFHVRF